MSTLIHERRPEPDIVRYEDQGYRFELPVKGRTRGEVMNLASRGPPMQMR
jgi:hypothetical protein